MVGMAVRNVTTMYSTLVVSERSGVADKGNVRKGPEKEAEEREREDENCRDEECH